MLGSKSSIPLGQTTEYKNGPWVYVSISVLPSVPLAVTKILKI